MAADADARRRYSQLRRARLQVPGGSSGDWGANLAKVANVLAYSPWANQNSREWQQIARGRRDVEQIESQLKRPNLFGVGRATEDRQRNFTSRRSEKGRQEILRENQRGRAHTSDGNSDGNRDHDGYRKARPRGGFEGNREARRSSRYRARDDRSGGRTKRSGARNEK